MSGYIEQPEPIAAPEWGDEGEVGEMAASVRRSSRRSRPARQSPEETSDQDDPSNPATKRTRRVKEKPSETTEETPPEQLVDSRIAAATLTMPMLETAKREKTKTAASKAALLNPPRQQATPDEGREQATDPVERATQYNAAMIQLEATISNLDHRIKKYNGHISVDDLEHIHDQFESFMNLHPILSPAAIRSRAISAAATAGTPSVPQPRKPGRPRKNDPPRGTTTAPSSAATFPTYGTYRNPMLETSHLHSSSLPPVPVFYSMPVTMDDDPPQPRQSYQPATYANPYDLNYQPEQVQQYAQNSEMPPQVPPEDQAAIAQATAAVRKAANDDAPRGMDRQTALQLLYILSTAGVGAQNLGNQGARQRETQPDTDELAASALMSLSSQRGQRVRSNTRTQPPPPTQPPPVNVESQLLALLMQSMGGGGGHNQHGQGSGGGHGY